MFSSVANEDLLDPIKTANLAVRWEDEETDDESDSGPELPALSGRGRGYGNDDSDSESDIDSESDEHPVDDTQDLANKRNRARVQAANRPDREIMGKYLPGNIRDLFGVRIARPDDNFVAPDEWLKQVKSVWEEKCQIPSKPDIKFDCEPESLQANAALLESYGFDLESLVNSQEGSTTWHGSEFCLLDQLGRFLSNHQLWGYLSLLFTMGMSYITTRDLTEIERKTELRAQLERGNHKSAMGSQTEARRLLEEDVKQGWNRRSVLSRGGRFETPEGETHPRPLLFPHDGRLLRKR